MEKLCTSVNYSHDSLECPKCRKNALHEKSKVMLLEEDKMEIDIECSECKLSFKEVFILSFIGIVIDSEIAKKIEKTSRPKNKYLEEDDGSAND